MSLSVVVADDHLDRFPEVVERLRSAGMEVEHVMQSLGTVTGSIPRNRAASLTNVRGVAAVEAERRYQLPPPDSDVQ